MTRLFHFLSIRPGEERMASLVIGVMLFTSLGAAFGGTAIEALFFARFGVEYLPYMFIGLGITNMIMSVGVTALLGRPRQVLYISIPLIVAIVLILARVALISDQIWSETQRRRFSQVFESEVVADGAAWIWNLVGDYFYDSYQLVDWFHGTEHLARVSHLLFGEGTPPAKRWLKERESLLYQGQAEAIVLEIRQTAEQQPGIQEDLLVEARYFENHKHRMNYMEMREDGWVIGSGMVESAGKQFKARFCGPGMRWSRSGAENLLPIRNAILSKRFPQRWNTIYNSPRN